MTNEEMALRIQAGEKELVPQLWEQTHKLIYALFQQMLRRSTATQAQCVRSGVTIEDLQQEGYFALLQAVAAYDPAKGIKFNSFLQYPVMGRLFAAIGLRTSRQKMEPLNRADSLDRPIRGEDDSITLGDAVADPASGDILEAVLDRVLHDELCQALDNCLSKLTPLQEWAIRQKYLAGHTLKEVAERQGCTPEYTRQVVNQGLRNLRKPQHAQELLPFLDEFEGCAYRGSLNRFRSRGASSVELTVEKIEQKWKQKIQA